MEDLSKKIEAILFFKNEPISKSKLSDMLKIDVLNIDSALIELKERLSDRGIVMIENGEEVMLATHPDFSGMIEKIRKEELDRDLSRASLETLSIILYKGEVSRAELDYIRGVNSTFILRALSSRGLVEKIPDPKDNRKVLYKPTFDLLSYLGINSIKELPEYESILSSIKQNSQESTESAEMIINEG